MDVYSKLYDITQENMKKGGQELVFTKAAFLFSTKCQAGKADLFQLMELDNQSFFQAAFVGFFYRIPDEGAMDRWNRECGLDKEEFQEKVIRSLTGSEEFRDKRVKLYHNIYSTNSLVRHSQDHISTSSYYMDRLYHIYRHLPGFLKVIAKKILKK